jgi:hypothetical protein
MKTFMILFVVALSMNELVRADDNSIALSIAVPALDSGNERSVVAFDRNSHFPVILTNTSDKPQRIVTPWNSWGDHALSFEITDRSGKKSVARAVAVDYTKNTLHWWTLQPQESVVFDVYFADSNKWEGFPHPIHYGDSETVTMRAIFQFGPVTQKAPEDGLWAGRVYSKPEQVVFYVRIPGK